jgi:hypothetical protein
MRHGFRIAEIAHENTSSSAAIADIRMACAASTAIKGSAITQASAAATKTSPMVKTDRWCRTTPSPLVLAPLRHADGL